MIESEVAMVRATKPRKCPRCKNSAMQTCVIGMPTDEDYFLTDKYFFLGCCAVPPWPKWHCTACDLFIHKRSDLN